MRHYVNIEYTDIELFREAQKIITNELYTKEASIKSDARFFRSYLQSILQFKTNLCNYSCN